MADYKPPDEVEEKGMRLATTASPTTAYNHITRHGTDPISELIRSNPSRYCEEDCMGRMDGRITTLNPPVPRITTGGLSWFIPVNCPAEYTRILRDGGFHVNRKVYCGDGSFDIYDHFGIEAFESDYFDMARGQKWAPLVWFERNLTSSTPIPLPIPRKLFKLAVVISVDVTATTSCSVKIKVSAKKPARLGPAFDVVKKFPGYRAMIGSTPVVPCDYSARAGCPYNRLNDSLEIAIHTNNPILLKQIITKCRRVLRRIKSPINFFIGMIEMCESAKKYIRVCGTTPGIKWECNYYESFYRYHSYRMMYDPKTKLTTAELLLHNMLLLSGFTSERSVHLMTNFNKNLLARYYFDGYFIFKHCGMSSLAETYHIIKLYCLESNLTPDSLISLITEVFGVANYLVKLHSVMCGMWTCLNRHITRFMRDDYYLTQLMIPKTYMKLKGLLALKYEASLYPDVARIVSSYMGHDEIPREMEYFQVIG